MIKIYSAREASKILGRDVNQDALVFDSPILPDKRVVLIYDNPDLISHFKGRYDTCNIIVHPGFCLVKDHSVGRYFFRKKGRIRKLSRIFKKSQ